MAKSEVKKSNIFEDKDLYYSLFPEYFLRMFDCLPLWFQEDEDEIYLSQLIKSFMVNYKYDIFQLAYLQYHMIFMTAIYYILWKISFICKSEFDKAIYYLLKDRNSLLYKKSNLRNGKISFRSFSTINESEILKLLHIIDVDDALIGDIKLFIKERNDYVHANGHLTMIDEKSFTQKKNEYDKKVELVENFFCKYLTNFYLDIISNRAFFSVKERLHKKTDIQIWDGFVKKYSLTKNELKILSKIKLSTFDKFKEGKTEILELHKALISLYKTAKEEVW